MEAPLNAREFLQRFHLPQLVRLSSASGEQLDQRDEDLFGGIEPNNELSEASLEHVNGTCVRVVSPNQSNTSISSSFVVMDNKQRQHEKSNWTYRAANLMSTKPQKVSIGVRSEQNLNRSVYDDDFNNDQDQFRSSQIKQSRKQFEEMDNSIDGENFDSSHRFRSISEWSTIHQLTGRKSIVEFETSNRESQQLARNSKKSVEFLQQQQVVQKVAQSSKWSEALQSIRLTPPSKRPALSKLQLNQPFLLYKAYKKLELCAYVIDLKNEVNEKSGDPIYFPQNYPGWFSIEQTTNNNKDKVNRAKPLESIDDVCRTGAQIFLTRDEIIAYQLPKKLSHLTKLKNNQLLALPLAINLNKAIKNNNESTSSTKDSKHDQKIPSNSISDIREIVIHCGQVMKICGVYEDVLPLIENGNNVVQGIIGNNVCKNEKQNHTRRSSVHKIPSYEQQTCTNLYYQMASQSPTSAIHRHQMAATAAAMVINQRSSRSIYPHQSEFQHLNRAIQSESSKQRRTLRSLKLRQAQNQSALAENGGSYSLNNPLILDQSSEVAQQTPQVKVQQFNKLRGRQEERSQQQQTVGQRYARCILLNQKSIDKITNCSSGVMNEATTKKDENDDESEVLIPMDQKGRFYLCATNQSIVTQLYCHGCTTASIQPSLVFRLSQIVSLINLSRRLAIKNRQVHQQSNQLPFRQERVTSNELEPVVKLPLPVQLVIGPRPANFSPTMFGSSSTMESYFRMEANVGGHLIQCNYNRQFKSFNGSKQKLSNQRQQQNYLSHIVKKREMDESICDCAQKLSNKASGECYSNFSATLRIEKIVKRDVLLACTIKRDPLLHLDLFTNENSQLINNNLESCEMGNKSNINSRAIWKMKKNCEMLIASGDFKFNSTSLTNSNLTDKVNSNKSQKLISLRESNNVAQDNLLTAKFDLKSIGKSSFSRLRACRSLISLNGRRKKRPNIPTSMLMASSSIGFDCATQGGSTNNHTSPSSSPSYNNSPHQHEVAESKSSLKSPDSANSTIVLIEFDCNNEELQFTRTFVESSIPTSTIPDLVLRRMEYCYRNSEDWERQLKLSHLTLKQDYDSCQLQMRQNRRDKLMEQHQQRLSSSLNSNNLIQSNTASSLSSSLAAFHVSSDAGSSSSSSSRSSSGVSSSVAAAAPTATTKLAADDCATIMNSQKIHKKLMRRNGQENGGGRHLEAEIDDDGGSPVNVAIVQQRAFNNRVVCSGQFNTLLGDTKPRFEQESEDSGSHLYESLERLNETRQQQHQEVICLNKQIKAASRSNALKNNDRSSSENSSGNDTSAKSRLKMGKSIDFLVNCKSNRIPSATTLAYRRGNSNNYKYNEDFGDEEEDDDDDDWWQRSTYNTRAAAAEQQKQKRKQKQKLPKLPKQLQQLQRQVVNSRESTRHNSSKNVVPLVKELNEADNWSSGVQTNRMEPVSIEACEEEFVSVVEDEDEGEDYSDDGQRRPFGGADLEKTSIEACSDSVSSSYQSSSGFCYTCSNSIK